MSAQVEFCGEIYELSVDEPFTVGRDADLVIDENPFLHRRFLQIRRFGDFWWLENIGSHLAATLSDSDRSLQAWLAPGARIPIVFAQVEVWFTAGPTTYEFTFTPGDAPFAVSPIAPLDPDVGGSTTSGRVVLTLEQRLLLLALAEPMLRRPGQGSANVPSSASVAERLGWTITKFNRKLDSVCQKLGSLGVAGLHGKPEKLAANRKARLVEYALAIRLVRAEDLSFFDEHMDHAQSRPLRGDLPS